MCENRGPQTDCAVVSNRDGIGMQFVNIDKLPDPNASADSHAPLLMKPWADSFAPRQKERKLVKDSTANTHCRGILFRTLAGVN
jgi:hypothetical protein